MHANCVNGVWLEPAGQVGGRSTTCSVLWQGLRAWLGNWHFRNMAYPRNGKFYLNGASGYTFSRKALKAYVEGPMETCKYVDDAMEDVLQAECLWSENYTEFNAFIDVRDEEGAHRYHALDLQFHSIWTPGKKILGHNDLYATAVIPTSLEYLEQEFGFPYVVQDKYISKSSVAFHFNTPSKLRRMEMLLYGNTAENCKL